MGVDLRSSTSAARLACLALAIVVVGCSGVGASGVTFADLWLTADQQGRWYWERRDYAEAANRFDDPMWRGTALYMSGDFEASLGEFGRLDTADAWLARGNALAHLKRYPEAVEAYDEALSRRPDWQTAQENRDYVALFVPWRPEDGGGEMGTIGNDARPDEIVFDADQERLEEEGIDTVMEDSVLTDEQITDMWLSQVSTSPTAFLRYKFSYQLAEGQLAEGQLTGGETE